MLPTYSTLPLLLQHALGEHDRESGNEEARVLYLYTSHNRTAYHAGGGRRVCRSAPPEWPPRDRMRRQPFTRVLRVGAADSNIGCMRWFSLPTRMFPLSNAYRLWGYGGRGQCTRDEPQPMALHVSRGVQRGLCHGACLAGFRLFSSSRYKSTGVTTFISTRCVGVRNSTLFLCWG